jgi:WD40 repeat protein
MLDRVIVRTAAAMVLCAGLLWAACGWAQEPAQGVSYYKSIRPMLQEHCQGCHQPARPEGKMVLSTYEGLLKPGESESAGVVPGKPFESYLIEQITPQGDDRPAMPKDKPPLSNDQIELVRRWIAEGAVDDTPESARRSFDADHPPTYPVPPVITALDYSPDGQLLAVSGYHEVLLFNADGSGLGGRLIGLSERIQSLAFSPDGKRLAVTGGNPCRFGEVQVWDVAERKMLLSISVTFDTVYGVSWSGDGTKLAFGCADNTVRAIDAATGQQVLFQGAHSDWVLDTVFSTDSSHLVSVSRDRSMKLTDVPTQRFEDNITSITPGELKGGLMAVDRHPTKDELLIGGADGEPKIYKMYREKARQIGDDFNRLDVRFKPMPGRIFSVEYSADGGRIAAASSSERKGEVRVYDAADGKLLATLEGQQGPVYSVAFSADGGLVAAGGFEGMVRVCEAATGKLVREFGALPGVP